jgi:hypothetical protein
MIVGLAFVVTIINMALLSLNFNWFHEGNLLIQVSYFSIVFIASWILIHLKNKKFQSIILIIFFITNSGFQLFTKSNDGGQTSNPIGNNALQSMVKGRILEVKPNIYLLVYDAYVNNETMLGYGIDNSNQEEYLRSQGFVLYPRTYSIAGNTLGTMSRVLNASTEFYGPERRAVSGDGIVQNTLKLQGYDTYGLFPTDYMFRGIGSSYNFSIPKGTEVPSYELLTSAILTGEFRFDLGFDKQPHATYVETKQSEFKSDSKNPVFMYSHSDLPGHSQNSGVCLKDETELFKGRLLNANNEMTQDINMIIEHDPEAIIIVAGDHGPYLTKNCYNTSGFYDISEISRADIQDRFGTFLAIRWPTKEYVKYDKITVLQDLFPTIFAYLYKDPKFLDLKVKPELIKTKEVSGASVKNGIIYGGINDGESLFLTSH